MGLSFEHLTLAKKQLSQEARRRGSRGLELLLTMASRSPVLHARGRGERYAGRS